MRSRGFIGLIVLIVIALILAKYLYNFSIFEAADSAQGRSTIGYGGQVFSTIWSYIASPVIFVGKEIILPLLNLFMDTFRSFIMTSHSAISTPGN